MNSPACTRTHRHTHTYTLLPCILLLPLGRREPNLAGPRSWDPFQCLQSLPWHQLLWSCAHTDVALHQCAKAEQHSLSCLDLCSGRQRRCETFCKAVAGNVDFTSLLMRKLRVIFRIKQDRKIQRPVLSEVVSSLPSSS